MKKLGKMKVSEDFFNNILEETLEELGETDKCFLDNWNI